jgi:ribose transport system ATP-binding protein
MLFAQNISKSFAGIRALDRVNIRLQAGRVCAIIGENGAGKSTLMKILSGVYTDFEGELFIGDVEVKFKNPKDAQEKGVAIIHQELNLLSYMSVAENIFLGKEITNKFGVLDSTQMEKKTKVLLEKLKLNIDPTTPIKDLKVGEQQLVEIAKALLHDAQVIIMDEPSSAITGAEVEVLFEIIENLKKEGKAIAYISHKLDEVFAIADDYCILRDGKMIEAGELKNINRNEIVAKMVGRELLSLAKKPIGTNLETLFELKNWQVAMNSSRTASYSFALKKGEVLGIFGIMGAGRTELLESIFGLRKANGEMYIEDKKVKIKSSPQAIKHGIAMLSEDRKKDGFIPEQSVKENISLSTLAHLAPNGIMNAKKENDLAQKYISELSIKTASADLEIKNLSGGNQQKVILAKCLATNPKIILLDEPTRGIDVNAKAEIYKIIENLAQKGIGVIIVSSELPEILAVSDRVLVLNEGKISGEFLAKDATEEKLLQAAIK